jgi:3-oxoadipate enol-lactonase
VRLATLRAGIAALRGRGRYARVMPHCAVADARIHYKVDGEGEPLVLIAGTAFDLSFWDDLLPELRGFRVLRLDNRGAGLPTLPMRP